MATPAHFSGDGLISAFSNKERTGGKKSAFLVAKQSGKSKSFSSLSHLVRLNLWSLWGPRFCLVSTTVSQQLRINTQVPSKTWIAQDVHDVNKIAVGLPFGIQLDHRKASAMKRKTQTSPQFSVFCLVSALAALAPISQMHLANIFHEHKVSQKKYQITCHTEEAHDLCHWLTNETRQDESSGFISSPTSSTGRITNNVIAKLSPSGANK